MNFDYKNKEEKNSLISNNDVSSILKKQHARNRADFLQRSHTMQFDQIFIENLLLRMEEQIFFGRQTTEMHGWDAEKEAELEFLKNLSCCNLNFANFTEWEIHMMKHDTKPVFSLDPCGDEIATVVGMIDKDMSSTSESTSESTASMPETKIKVYKCDHENCNKLYTSAYGLRYHLEKGHRENDDSAKPFTCTFKGCRKRYKNANGLKYHLVHGHV